LRLNHLCRYSQWLENSAQVEVQAPIEIAWELWEDRERIPTWMPWITSVVIQKENPHMSKWTLSTFQFNRQWEFSWLARNMTPLKYQKIHWRSVPGSSGGSLGPIEIQNQGQIRFLKKAEDACAVKLTISYEVPGVLAPFANVCTMFCCCCCCCLFGCVVMIIIPSSSSSSSCVCVQLLTPVVEGILQQDMDRFAAFATKEYQSSSS